MIQQQFKELIKLYQRAAEGDALEELQLFASAISFLENLKFALQEGSVARPVGMAMIELLRQHSEAYDTLLERRKRSGIHQASASVKDADKKRELQAKLVVLAKDLGEFFRQTEDQEIPPTGQGVKTTRKPRRLSRHNWLRS